MESLVDAGAGSVDSQTVHPPQRTAEEVTASAKAAGLVVEGGGPVQLLHFSPHLHSEDIKLLEVHGPVLSTLTQGEK